MEAAQAEADDTACTRFQWQAVPSDRCEFTAYRVAGREWQAEDGNLVMEVGEVLGHLDALEVEAA